MPRKKHFTPREVDQLIPLLERIFVHLHTCKARAEALRTSMRPLPPGASAAELAEAQMARSQAQFMMQAVQDDVDHLLVLGGVVKDLEGGLVDFPGLVAGDDVWLCWKMGEARVRYWHPLDQGFSQRQTLTRPGNNITTH